MVRDYRGYSSSLIIPLQSIRMLRFWNVNHSENIVRKSRILGLSRFSFLQLTIETKHNLRIHFENFQEKPICKLCVENVVAWSAALCNLRLRAKRHLVGYFIRDTKLVKKNILPIICPTHQKKWWFSLLMIDVWSSSIEMNDMDEMLIACQKYFDFESALHMVLVFHRLSIRYAKDFLQGIP